MFGEEKHETHMWGRVSWYKYIQCDKRRLIENREEGCVTHSADDVENFRGDQV